jgi:NAD(P)-dependent dehydrogenase (short-subunit alcohol dehydrogenase family)
VSKAFEIAISTTGAIDILVNNAGYLPEASPLVSADLETWWKGFEVNVLGVARVTQAFLRTKPHGRAGVVLTVNTGIAHDGNFPGFSSYASSKLAALRMIDIWQVENPEVRFVSIHPGKVDTAMFAKSGMAREGLTDVSLPADALVWLSSDGPEADFLKGKMFWVQWDVPELLEKKEKIEAGYELASGLRGLEGSVF